MSKNNKLVLDTIFQFPTGVDDPFNPVPGQAYFNESINYLRIFGANNKWGVVPMVWDDIDTPEDGTTDKE